MVDSNRTNGEDGVRGDVDKRGEPKSIELVGELTEILKATEGVRRCNIGIEDGAGASILEELEKKKKTVV